MRSETVGIRNREFLHQRVSPASDRLALRILDRIQSRVCKFSFGGARHGYISPHCSYKGDTSIGRWEQHQLLGDAFAFDAELKGRIIDWQYDPNLLTEVEVKFTSVGSDATRVELEHRLLENTGDRAEAAREAFDSPGGWPGLLEAYSAKAKAS